MQRLNKIRNKVNKKEKYFDILIILLISIFVCIPLLDSKLDISYDDGIQHISRIIGTYQGLKNGQTAIFQNFCNNFGYSWNLFYSPITAYLPLLFKPLNVSFAICIKMFMLLVTFLSGYFMYLFVKKLTKNRYIGIISSVLYIVSPYRITDMYIRNALAELTSFVFLPLVFLGIYNLFNNTSKIKNTYIPLIVGSVGLILSHTIITIYTAIFAFIYVLINIIKLLDLRKTIKNKKQNVNKKHINIRNRIHNKNRVLFIIRILLISVILILIITAFFWMPLLQLKNSTQYEVFKPGRMERTEVLIAYKLDFYRIFFTLKNDYMYYDIGLITFLGLMFTPLVINRIKKEKFYLTYKFMLFAGIISCIMTLKIFPFEKLPATLKMLQFSFRMLEFSSFFLSTLAGINIVLLSKKFDKKELIILLFVVMILTIPYREQIRTIENYDEQRLIDTVPVTNSTGRVHAGCASFEYLPSKAFENRYYIETRNQEVIILNGTATLENQNKNNDKMSLDIKDVEEGTTIELPYIYYPGYSIKLRYEGKVINLDTFETDNGFVGTILPATDSGIINIEYKGTNLMNITKLTSFIGTCLFIIVLFEHKLRVANKHKNVEKNA